MLQNLPKSSHVRVFPRKPSTMTSSPPFDQEAGDSAGKDKADARMLESQETDDQEDLQPWYNEVHPDLFKVLKEVPDKQFPLIENKWRREIRCDDLDYQQRMLLRNDRMARVYLNPMALRTTPSKGPVDVDNRRKRAAFAVLERLAVRNKSEQGIRTTSQIYGVHYKLPGSAARVRNTCLTSQLAPPYFGRHAILIKPSEAIKASIQSDHYQIVHKNREAHVMSEAEGKLVRRYPTTALALWRQQRFSSPDGCDYRVMREHVRAARYKAMLAAAEGGTKDLEVGVETTRVWSNYHPSMAESKGKNITGEEKVDETPPVAGEEEGVDGQEKTTEEMKRKEAIFALNEEYLEDLIDNNKKLRDKLMPYVVPQPKGLFFKDPKTDPWYLKHCLRRSDYVKHRIKSSSSVGASGIDTVRQGRQSESRDNSGTSRQRRQSESKVKDETEPEIHLQVESVAREQLEEGKAQNIPVSESRVGITEPESDLPVQNVVSEQLKEDKTQDITVSKSRAGFAEEEVRIASENDESKQDANQSKHLFKGEVMKDNMQKNISTEKFPEDIDLRRSLYNEKMRGDETFLAFEKIKEGRSQVKIRSKRGLEDDGNEESEEENSNTEAIREDEIMTWFEEKDWGESEVTLWSNEELEEDDIVAQEDSGNVGKGSNKLLDHIMHVISEEGVESDNQSEKTDEDSGKDVKATRKINLPYKDIEDDKDKDDVEK